MRQKYLSEVYGGIFATRRCPLQRILVCSSVLSAADVLRAVTADRASSVTRAASAPWRVGDCGSSKEAFIRQSCARITPSRPLTVEEVITFLPHGEGRVVPGYPDCPVVTPLEANLSQVAGVICSRAASGRSGRSSISGRVPMIPSSPDSLSAARQLERDVLSCCREQSVDLFLSDLDVHRGGQQLRDTVLVAEHTLRPSGTLLILLRGARDTVLSPELRRLLKWRFREYTSHRCRDGSLLCCQGTGEASSSARNRRTSPAAYQSHGRRPVQWAPVKGKTAAEKRAMRYVSVIPAFATAPYTKDALLSKLSAKDAAEKAASHQDNEFFEFTYDYVAEGRYDTNVED